MPVQRIARYPLLLQTIQKHTDKTHPAYALLKQTAHTSIALNCRINEYKRFREVGEEMFCSKVITRYSAILIGVVVQKSTEMPRDNNSAVHLHALISADKYKKTEQLSIKDKINRLNTHSIAKKTARISQHFKHEAGIAPKVW